MTTSEDTYTETVILLHGIGHTSWNMRHVERALKDHGYRTLNITYPSCKMAIGDLAVFVAKVLKQESVWQYTSKVHFVTHSMGGLVTQRYLEDFRADIPVDKLGRVVMIAPPQKGSEVADFLQNLPPYKWVFGPAGQELTTTIRNSCKIRPYYELGIIAGDKGWPYFIAHFLFSDRHDGRVAVEKTKINEMKSHIVIPCTHGFISWEDITHRQVINFLVKGLFCNQETTHGKNEM